MNWLFLGMLDGATLINWLTSYIHDTAKRSWPNWNHDGRPSISGRPSSNETFGTCVFTSVIHVTRRSQGRRSTIHSNSSDHIFTQMLLLSVSSRAK